MSDSYQAIYDATRSRIGGCDAAAEIFRVALALEVERDELRALLAASQAHAKALREALERADAARCTCPCHTEGGYCDQCCCGVESANICRDALALPADTSALVEQRAQELDAAFVDKPGAVWDGRLDQARLSLRREVEACEPLVKALEEDVKVYAYHDLIASEERVEEVLRAHRARYAPAPETLADVAREAAEALRGNAALSARLLAAVEREVKP